MPRRLPTPDVPGGPTRIGILADAWHEAASVALAFYGTLDDVWVLAPSDTPAHRTGVLAIDAETRDLSPGRAAAGIDAACRALIAAGAGRFFMATDPHLRGHVGLEALQAIATLGRELAVIAPACLEAGITTVGGYQLRDGVPIGPPGEDPHLPTRLAARGAIAHLALRDVMEGPERVAQGIARAVQARVRLLVVDAASPEDLRAIARAMALVPFRLLPVGTPGLARALQPHRILTVTAPPRRGPILVGPRAPVLVVIGSRHPATIAQREMVRPAASEVVLDVSLLLLAGEPALTQAIAAASQRLLGKLDVVLVAEGSPTLGRDLGLSDAAIAAYVADALARITAAAVANVGPGALAGIVVSGSETAAAVRRALAPGPLRVTGAPLPDAPLLQAEGPDGLRLTTKTGPSGEPDALARLIAHMKREDAS